VILVVEDDPELRAMLCEVLEDEGYEVVTASNGEEALIALRSHRGTCAIFLDVMMPVMGGFEFRKAQREDPELSVIPVVAMSARWNETERLDTPHCMAKPFARTAMLAYADRFCRQGEHAAPKSP
jgi:CheY-like chemotaxis protein